MFYILGEVPYHNPGIVDKDIESSVTKSLSDLSPAALILASPVVSSCTKMTFPGELCTRLLIAALSLRDVAKIIPTSEAGS